jgi:putative Mg2+ transporter-C (MgtC) family protein
MPPHVLEVALNLAVAWACGAVIGLERSFNGRAAGFRTHSIVAIASSATAMISIEPMFVTGLDSAMRLDPTRLAQGVMTGIGFLGAGVIFKEGLSVQGLTTAASIWACAAAGFLCGLGEFWVGALSTAAVMVTLTLFRLIEARAPWRIYAYAVLRFDAAAVPDEAALAAMLDDHGIALHEVSYRLIEGGRLFEYSANLETGRGAALGGLAQRLRAAKGLVEFELSRISK